MTKQHAVSCWLKRCATKPEVMGSNPAEAHSFFLRHIGQSCAATWKPGIGPPHIQSASIQLPSRYPYCHVTVRMPSQQYDSSNPYYHVSPCDWSILYGCHVSPCQWCHVAPPFCQICLFHQYNRMR